MNLTIDRGPLLAALSSLSGVVQRKSTIPILTNLLLEVSAETLRITATDLDMFAAVTVELDGAVTPGRLTLSADKLLGLVKSLPEGADLTVKHDGSDARVTVQAGRSRFQMTWLPAGDFPRLNEAAITDSMTLPAVTLARLLEVGSSQINEQEVRTYFVCAHMTTVQTDEGRKVRVVSYGGNSLVYCQADCPPEVEDFAVSIPPKLVKAALSFLKDRKPLDPVEVGLASGMVTFDFGDAKLSGKLLGEDLKYPPYERVIPAGKAGAITVDTDLITGALGRALLMADEKLAFRITLEAGEDQLRLASQSAAAGGVEDFVDMGLRGEGLRTPLNGTMLADLLRFVRSESVVISYDQSGNCPTLRIEELAEATDWLGVMSCMGGDGKGAGDAA